MSLISMPIVLVLLGVLAKNSFHSKMHEHGQLKILPDLAIGVYRAIRRWYNGEISKEEIVKIILRAFVVVTGAVGDAAGGCALGSAVGGPAGDSLGNVL